MCLEKNEQFGGEIKVAGGPDINPADEGGEKPDIDRDVNTTLIEGEDIDAIGDLGNEFDDPEGWMSERTHYWSDLAKASHPTRAALLRHRIAECFSLLRALACRDSLGSPTDRLPKSEWQKSADELFGYSLRAIRGEPTERKQPNTSPHKSKVGSNAGQCHAAYESLDWPPRPSHPKASAALQPPRRDSIIGTIAKSSSIDAPR